MTDVSAILYDVATAIALSWARMVAALLLSLGFSWVVGIAAGLSKRTEKIVIPTLDILQSIPILGFFPIVVFVLAGIHETLGPELAAIMLIFTSQVWNIVFGAYEATRMVPDTILESVRLMKLTFWQRMIRLYIPVTMPRVAYNIIPSWSNGLYFLIASELISVGHTRIELHGIGALALRYASQGEFQALLIAVAGLVLAVAATNVLLWLPLLEWATTRFRYEAVAGERREVWFEKAIRPLSRIAVKTPRVRLELGVFSELSRTAASISRVVVHRRAVLQVIMGVLLLMLGLLFFASVGMGLRDFLQRLFLEASQAEWPLIAISLLTSFLRVIVALALGVAWTLPMAVLMATRPGMRSALTPTFQIIGSIPGTIFFPLLAVLLHQFYYGLEFAAILMILLGTQWYLLFSIFGVVSMIPRENLEVAELFAVRGWRRWRSLYLPMSMPGLVTGAITAVGGGWNTLVVAERLQVGGLQPTRLEVPSPGIGKMMSVATERGDVPTLFITLTVMTMFIALLNKLGWRRFYDWAISRFKYMEAVQI